MCFELGIFSTFLVRLRCDYEFFHLYKASAAVHGAVGVLGAATGRSLMAQAETLSVVAGVKNALRVLPKDSVDPEELEMVKDFLNNPLHKKTEGSAFGWPCICATFAGCSANSSVMTAASSGP